MRNQIKGFLETSFIDWPGKIVSVLFLPHCNFRCPYCHNYGLVLNPEQYQTISVGYILHRMSTLTGWVDGICITGGEPTLFPSLAELIGIFKAQSLLVKVDTNGTRPKVLRELLTNKLVDYIAMDVKGPLDAARYARYAGVPVNLSDILEAINLIKEGTVPYEFRLTVVPGLINEDDIIELAEQLTGSRKLTLQNFNPHDPLDPGLKNIKPYDDKALKRLQYRVSEIIQNTVNNP